jgi:DNA-binding NtrC family response regulator
MAQLGRTAHLVDPSPGLLPPPVERSRGAAAHRLRGPQLSLDSVARRCRNWNLVVLSGLLREIRAHSRALGCETRARLAILCRCAPAGGALGGEMTEPGDVTEQVTCTEAPSGRGGVPGLVVVFSSVAQLSGASLPLLRAPQVLGRRTALEGDRVLADPRVSARHVEVRLIDDETVEVRDLGSRNGTLINGEKVERAHIGDADVLEIGDTFLQFVPDLLAHAAPEQSDAISDLVLGRSPLARQLRDRLREVAVLDLPVLLLGPPGAGKENCARALHRASGRQGPFVSLNCALMTDELAASDLFGHTKGAFSGASAARLGAFRQADGGTLLLDEIADLPASVQPKLLRALQEWSIMPVGSDRELKVDVRLVAATNRYLPHSVRQGQFRGDLYSRLAAATVEVPALRDRPADVVSLARHFLGAERPLHARAVRDLLAHPWPYNVRELKTVMALIPADGVVPVALNATARDTMRRSLDAHVADEQPATAEVEWPSDPAERMRTLERLLAECDGNVAQVARLLDKRVTSVRRWIARYEIDLERYRASEGAGLGA